MNIQLLNHQIQVDFINGYEYLDNIGKILALIANERNNINLNSNNNLADKEATISHLQKQLQIERPKPKEPYSPIV